MSIEAIRAKLAETPTRTVKYPSMDGWVDREYGPTFSAAEMREVLGALDRSETALANILRVLDEQERSRSTSENP